MRYITTFMLAYPNTINIKQNPLNPHRSFPPPKETKKSPNHLTENHKTKNANC